MILALEQHFAGVTLAPIAARTKYNLRLWVHKVVVNQAAEYIMDLLVERLQNSVCFLFFPSLSSLPFFSPSFPSFSIYLLSAPSIHPLPFASPFILLPFCIRLEGMGSA